MNLVKFPLLHIYTLLKIIWFCYDYINYVSQMKWYFNNEIYNWFSIHQFCFQMKWYTLKIQKNWIYLFQYIRKWSGMSDVSTSGCKVNSENVLSRQSPTIQYMKGDIVCCYVTNAENLHGRCLWTVYTCTLSFLYCHQLVQMYSCCYLCFIHMLTQFYFVMYYSSIPSVQYIQCILLSIIYQTTYTVGSDYCLIS